MGDEKRSLYRIEEMRVLAGVQPGGMIGLEEGKINESNLKKMVDAMIGAPKFQALTKDVPDRSEFLLAVHDAVKPVLAQVLKASGVEVSGTIVGKSKKALRDMAKAR